MQKNPENLVCKFYHKKIIFICENNRKSNKIMYCINLVFLVVALKIWAVNTYFKITDRYIKYLKMPISSKLLLKKKDQHSA